MTYRLKVTYAAGNTQVHERLTAEQAEVGGGAFLRDLCHLGGEGVGRLVVEVEGGRELAVETAEMTPAFRRAVERVAHDTRLDEGEGADLIAVGVERQDCLAFLQEMVEDERITAELLAVIVQWAVATGVWLERERWEAA